MTRRFRFEPDEVEAATRRAPDDNGPLFKVRADPAVPPGQVVVVHGERVVGRVLNVAPPSVPVDTSVAAATRIAPTAAAIRDRVLEHVTACGPFGATEQEVEGALALAGNTARPRLWELEGAGLIVKSIKTRPTRSGRQARVYVAVSCGR